MEEKECKNCAIHSHNEHSHHEHEEETSKAKIILYIISVIIFVVSFLPIFKACQMWLCLVTIIISGYDLILEGIKNIFKLNFEEETLMTIAIIAAFILGEFPESCMIILLFKLGEFLEDKAVDNSNKNIKHIAEIKSNTANLIKEDGNIEVVDVEQIKVGDTILIKPGEIVPVDSKIIKGNATLDVSKLTGESIPQDAQENQKILSGSINLNGSLTCEVLKDYKNSTASQIVDLVYEATNNKGKTEAFITKFSKIYTPIVIVIALLVAILPPIILQQEFKVWIMRALVFLVASCPCSIVIATPLAFFSCIGAASKNGMLIKGTKHIEALAYAKCIALDKTGTITTGKMEVDEIITQGEYDEKEILKYMYALEKNSNHPISTAIAEKVEKENLECNYIANNYEEIAGHGVKAEINGKQVLFGNEKLLSKSNIDENVSKSANYLIIDNKLVACVTFKEEIRKNQKDLVKDLQKVNIEEVVMLTGDNYDSANNIANQVGISKVFAQLLPQGKQEKIKELKQKGKVVFVGDGINDSISLAEADFGISMGEAAEIANSAADGILMSNNILALPKIIKIAKKTMKIVKENIIFSLIVKLIVLTLGVLGYAPVWLAVIADTGVSLLTVLNSLRI